MKVVLISTVYIGMPRLMRAMASVERVAKELGSMDEWTRTQWPLPAGG